jgi:hypothetical protein
LDASGTATITAADIDAGSNDNCGAVSLSLDVTSFDCSDLGNNTVTLTVEDACGNQSTCTATVTVEDNLGPDLTCPTGRNEIIDINDEFSIPDYSSLVTFSDNCDASPTLSQSPPIGTIISGEGTIEPITFTATDFSGNITQCSFNITLTDTSSLSIVCPPDRIELVDNSCEFELPDYTSLATTTDAVSVTQSPVAGTIISGHGTNQVITLTAFDAGGASVNCTFTVTLADPIAPTFTSCPAETIEPADDEYLGANVTWTEPTYADNCSGATLSSTHASGDFFAVGRTTVEYVVEDAAGLTDTCRFDVVVTEAPPPTITGLTDVCTPGQETYSVTDPGSYTFMWTVINGTIVGPDNNSSVVVDWTGTVQGQLEVTITSGSGGSVTGTLSVDKYATPSVGNINSSGALIRR